MLNFWAIVLSSIIYLVISSFWYSSAMFGPVWRKMVGMSKKDAVMKGNMFNSMLIAFTGGLVMAYVLDNVIELTAAQSVLQGALIGFYMWLGFIATTMLGIVLWERRPVGLYVLNNSCILVSLLIIGGILAVV